MAQRKIFTEQSANQNYWIAWLEGFKDYYSIGDTEEQAIDFLKSAIELRPDIYKGVST